MRIASVVTPVVALYAAVVPSIAAQDTPAAVPSVDVWISSPPMALGHSARVTARAVSDPQAYIVVFRVTSDNRIVVVAPRTPYGAYRVPNGGLRSDGLDVSFRTERTNGVGYLFAVASYTPFDFSRIRLGGRWDTERLRTPPHGDAVDVADWFVQQIVLSRTTSYGINDVAYYVGVTPPENAQGSEQQYTPDDAVQSETQNTAVYATPMYDNPSYYDQYGYVPWYNNNFYWYDPYAGSLGSGYVKRCPDGSVVSIRAACPVVLQEGQHPHRVVPRRPTPPHIMPSRPLRRPPPSAPQVQALPPSPLLTPPVQEGRSHYAVPVTPRPTNIGVYNRPIVHATAAPRAAPPAPRPTQSAPPTSPSRAGSSVPSQRH